MLVLTRFKTRTGFFRVRIDAHGDPTRDLGHRVPGVRTGWSLTSCRELRQENEALRNRISRLSAAVLRVSASLDLDTVLHEVVESARALTGARRAVITTHDEKGQVLDFVSSGMAPEELRQLTAWSDASRLFEHLRDHPGTLRVPDLPAYARSLGLSADPLPSTSLQGTPLRHRGEHVGNFFLGDKAVGEEFTDEDEEVLVLFAAQAATAIANARVHQDERRARTDLETLIDTSPVGVAVFDAKTGALMSMNRETRRIIEGLRLPGRPPEDLLGVLTVERADGRRVSLTEYKLSDRFSTAETVRAEEMVLSVPDGRSVRILMNVTPNRSANGEVESVVVTLQDLAPLEELERLRAEFLAMVSHELRAPLTSIKGSAATVLDAVPALDPAEMLQFFRIVDEQAEHMRGLIGDLLDAGRIETGTLSVAPGPATVTELVDQARKTFLSGGGRHAVLLDLPPDLPRVMADRRRLVQVLNNLFSNASRHSPQTSPIRVAGAREGVHVAISVSDEGRGVPPELLPHLFRKHAGAGDRDGGAGSGLGLAICKGLVEAHGGRIWAESSGPGRGTRVTFTIPVTEEVDEGAGTGNPSGRSRRQAEGRGRKRILVVDDDPLALRHVRDALNSAGHAALVTGDPRELAHLIRTRKPHLIVLDLMLPGMDGIELMERMPEMADVPVIFISGYGRDETIARALEAGAADYVVKPFSPTELTARVQAALRRRAEAEPFRLGKLAIDYERRRVAVNGRPVPLTATEYELLRVLSLSVGRVVTHDALLHRVWRERDSADARLVRAFVKRLRRKLGDEAARPAYIFTERGVGYRMAGHAGG